jgi:hypothetical protein
MHVVFVWLVHGAACDPALVTTLKSFSGQPLLLLMWWQSR